MLSDSIWNENNLTTSNLVTVTGKEKVWSAPTFRMSAGLEEMCSKPGNVAAPNLEKESSLFHRW